MAVKFDYIIGNPPYQESSAGEKISDASIYSSFMDSVYEVGDRVELITPARFLFDNGNTSSVWNQKMLNDTHFKVLFFEIDSSKVFPKPIDIKGGVAVHYRDVYKDFGCIGCFTAYPELNGILHKVIKHGDKSIMDIIYNQNKFNLEQLYTDYPDLRDVISSNGREKRLTSGCIGYSCFHIERESDNDVGVLGLENLKRVYRYVDRAYIDSSDSNLFKYKVIVPANNGSGAIGEVLSTPLIGEPLIGYTQTFISFGAYDDLYMAENTMKYIKSKFARTLLGVLKVTQNGKKPVWKYVPLQDFTSNSDIDWSASIPNIDRQLYRKYGLMQEEIDFIETHVKPME